MLRGAIFLVATLSLPVHADNCYTVDGSRGSVTYEVKQAGSPFRGKFVRFGGEACFSEERATHMELWLDPGSVDSGLPEIDAALKDKDFFAVREYPRIVYSSQSVETRGNSQLAHGTLQVKGIRRNLDVPFNLQRDGSHLVAAGTLKLNRLDSGVGTGDWSNTNWLSSDVTVSFHATLSGG